MAIEKKWIGGAIKRPPGTLREKLGAKTEKGPRGGEVKKPIPAAKLTKVISRLQKKGQGKKKLHAGEISGRAVLVQPGAGPDKTVQGVAPDQQYGGQRNQAQQDQSPWV